MYGKFIYRLTFEASMTSFELDYSSNLNKVFGGNTLKIVPGRFSIYRVNYPRMSFLGSLCTV